MKHFAISLTGTYTRDEIPPRCRKPRPVTYETSAQVEVPTASSDDAPVAFRIREVEDRIKEIRTFDGRLFAPYLPHSHQEEPSLPGSVHFPQGVDTERSNLRHVTFNVDSDEAYYRQAQEHYRRFLIIDGVVWEETTEPGYHVAVFGFGNVSLGVSDRKDHGTLFRADEFDAALAWARELTSERRGPSGRYTDPEGVERYRAIEVLIPEAVTLVTVAPAPKEVRDLRIEYSMARDRFSRAESPDEETRYFAEVVRLRDEIIKKGHSPVKSDARPYEARHGAKEAL